MSTATQNLVSALTTIQTLIIDLHRELDTATAGGPSPQDQGQLKTAYDALQVTASRWLYQGPS